MSSVREQLSRIGCASNWIGLELVAREPLESSATHADEELSVRGGDQVAQPHSRRLISFGRSGFPSPKPGFRASPQNAGAVLRQTPDERAEPAVLQVTLRPSAANFAQLAFLRERAGPHRSVAVFEQGCHEDLVELRIVGQLGAIPANKTREGADPERSIARHQQAVGFVGELLTCGRLPASEVKAIETKQSEFPAEPQIAVGCLGHREDGAQRVSVPDGPRGVRVLADLQRRVEREGGRVRNKQCRDQHQAGHDHVSSSTIQLTHAVSEQQMRTRMTHQSSGGGQLGPPDVPIRSR